MWNNKNVTVGIMLWLRITFIKIISLSGICWHFYHAAFLCSHPAFYTQFFKSTHLICSLFSQRKNNNNKFLFTIICFVLNLSYIFFQIQRFFRSWQTWSLNLWNVLYICNFNAFDIFTVYTAYIYIYVCYRHKPWMSFLIGSWTVA